MAIEDNLLIEVTLSLKEVTIYSHITKSLKCFQYFHSLNQIEQNSILHLSINKTSFEKNKIKYINKNEQISIVIIQHLRQGEEDSRALILTVKVTSFELLS